MTIIILDCLYMYKCGAVFKGETVQIKKKQDRENRVELDSKDHSKKTSEEIF